MTSFYLLKSPVFFNYLLEHLSSFARFLPPESTKESTGEKRMLSGS
jgi:hypothetical protein